MARLVLSEKRADAFVAKVLKDKTLQALVKSQPRNYDKSPFGLTSGGCHSFARALTRYIKGERWAVWSYYAKNDDWVPEHVVFKVGNSFYDGSGKVSEQSLLSKYRGGEYRSKTKANKQELAPLLKHKEYYSLDTGTCDIEDEIDLVVKKYAKSFKVESGMKHLVVLAFTEKDFLSWDKPTQKQWMKDHPDSKFGDALKKGAGKGATLVPKTAEKKPKLSQAEKDKKSKEKFLEAIKDKAPAQKKVYIAAFKEGIRIPPAWTNASWHGMDAKDGIVARGTDTNGEHQVLENAEVRAAKTVEKHIRIQKTLEPVFDKLTKKLKVQASAGTPEAEILYIMTKMAFRIGGKVSGKAKHIAYGATSLLVKHASVDADGLVTFDFPAKHNKRQLHTTKDPVIAGIIKSRSEGKEGDEQLFPSNEAKVRKHWQSIGGSEKPHDIRSIWATRLAKKVVDESDAPKTKKEYTALVNKASEAAAAKLGNRPSQALESYIDHSVFPEAPE